MALTRQLTFRPECVLSAPRKARFSLTQRTPGRARFAHMGVIYELI